MVHCRRIKTYHDFKASHVFELTALLRAWEVSKAGALTGGNVPGEPARPACRQTDPAGGQWKLYSLAKLRAPRVLFENAPFPQAPGYTPADKALRTLLAEVPYQAQQPPYKD